MWTSSTARRITKNLHHQKCSKSLLWTFRFLFHESLSNKLNGSNIIRIWCVFFFRFFLRCHHHWFVGYFFTLFFCWFAKQQRKAIALFVDAQRKDATATDTYVLFHKIPWNIQREVLCKWKMNRHNDEQCIVGYLLWLSIIFTLHSDDKIHDGKKEYRLSPHVIITTHTYMMA